MMLVTLLCVLVASFTSSPLTIYFKPALTTTIAIILDIFVPRLEQPVDGMWLSQLEIYWDDIASSATNPPHRVLRLRQAEPSSFSNIVKRTTPDAEPLKLLTSGFNQPLNRWTCDVYHLRFTIPIQWIFRCLALMLPMMSIDFNN
jgi:hypothetical protein